MENFIASVLSGVSQVVGKLLGHPLEFLAGKYCKFWCSAKCKPTWDFICYIENFCLTLLLKSAMVIVMLYCLLLLLYLSYQLGICQCICHIICRSIRACFAMFFSVLECCCTCLCSKLHNHNQLHRQRKAKDIEAIRTPGYFEELDHEHSISHQAHKVVELKHHSRRPRSHRRQKEKDENLRRALRPRSHRVHVGVSNDSFYLHRKNSIRDGGHISPGGHVRVARTSKFARKRGGLGASIHHRRRYPTIIS